MSQPQNSDFCCHHNEQKLKTASPFAYYEYSKNDDCALFMARFGLDRQLDKPTIDELVSQCWHSDHDVVMANLRQLRKKLMVRWIYQDALSLVGVPALTAQLSWFADSVICFAKQVVYDKLCLKYGKPTFTIKNAAYPDEFAVVAMGKLGAGELNLSSDIDLVFIHANNGQTDGKKSIANQQFMTYLGRGMIRLINEMTQDGFVFRVDMRLRPWGDGASLVMTVASLANYFDQHGRTWERFAWLKARVVNPVSDELLATINQLKKDFVFRYYVDYTAFSALREMRMLIANQVAQREELDNIKLGVGGIRDIEFIAQSYALIYGGQFAILTQKTACLDALYALSELNLLDHDTADTLKKAYLFLRRLEHAIQARHDTQSQKLPTGDELFDIAKTMGFVDGDDLKNTLNFHRQQVRIPFDELVAKRETISHNMPIDHKANVAKLDEHISVESRQRLEAFWQSKLINNLSDEEKKRLHKAYPVIVYALLMSDKQSVDVALERVLSLLEAIVKRSIYLIMLSENPKATKDLLPMLAVSSWVANELVAYPVLLDTFLQKRYTHLPNKSELTHILQQSLLSVPTGDDEAFLQVIRLFKKTQVLAVACSDVLSHHPIMKVSDSLTFIAEVVLQACLDRAFSELSYKHGVPIHKNGKMVDGDLLGFAIIGYGKLGGLEMSYASDLDVVFVHNIDENRDTTGRLPISGMKFAIRLVQKIINYLTAPTRDGSAYELDMRLRPSGNAGVMVVSLQTFGHYQSDKAWVWEHQALVRARAICGDRTVLADFVAIRQSILTRWRDIATIKQEVRQMRQKMTDHLSLKDPTRFHLKHDWGGLVDIEFMAQFAVLAYAHCYADLAVWSDNVRIFEVLGKSILPDEISQKLIDSYLALRATTHLLALDDKKPIITDQSPQWQAFMDIRLLVKKWWCYLIEETS